MAFTRIIAHQIQRLLPEQEATLKLRPEECELDGRLEECARELKLTFIKKQGKMYGRFSSDIAEHPISACLKQYREERISFTTFTHTAMKHFKADLDKVAVPVEAYVFFVEEQLENTEVLSIYLVYHNSAQYLNGELKLEDSLYLDTSGIKLAARINLTEWQSDDAMLNYLSVLPWRGEKELTDVFVHFSGITDKLDIKAETETFLEIVTDYAQTQPEETAREIKNTVVDYCLEQHKQGRPVLIKELSPQISEETQDKFEKFAQQKQPQLRPELIPDQSQLRQYIRISGRDERLSMSFSAECLGESIVYNEDDDSLVINNIPSSLKSRLVKHLKG